MGEATGADGRTGLGLGLASAAEDEAQATGAAVALRTAEGDAAGVGATPGFPPELTVGAAVELPGPADDGIGVPALAEVFAALCPPAPPAAEPPAPFARQPPQSSTRPALPAAAQITQPVLACPDFRVESMHSS